MPLLSATDLQGMLEAVGGVPITAGAISGVGVYKKNHEMIFEDNMMILEHAVRATTDQFGHLDYGDSLVVFDANGSNGVTFKVDKKPMQINDGMVCMIGLAKVDAPGPLYVILNGDPSGATSDPAPAEQPILILNGDS